MILRIIRKCLVLWRVKTDPVKYARSVGVRVGERCRLIGIEPGGFGPEPYLIRLGNHVTITHGVRFITHDGGVWVFRDRDPDISVYAPIVVGNNVFIGINTIILPGVTIGDDCIIGAGSVVTRDIPSGSVAAGVPARPVRRIEDYWEKVRLKALSIRSIPDDERRRVLESHFWAGEPADDG